MGRWIVEHLQSTAQLRAAARDWNDLWARSPRVRPTARAEVLALWCDHFAPQRPFSAVVVKFGGRWVAALPLVGGRCWGCRASLGPGNAWSPAVDLLLDPDVDTHRACDALLSGLLPAAGASLLRFDGVQLHADRWATLAERLQAGAFGYAARRSFSVPMARISGDWPGYLATRSRNHRRQLRRIERRATELGVVHLERHDATPVEQVELLLRECFDVEAGGWKGAAGGAVLAVAGAWDFYRQQAQLLARAGQLSLTILRLRDRAVAFEYGWRAGGVLSALKIGYDESLARLSPGQLLRLRLFEQLHADKDIQWVDFVGPTSYATDQWATHRYEVGRLVIAAGGTWTRAAVAGYRFAAPLAGRLRKRGLPVEHAVRPALTSEEPAVPSEMQPAGIVDR